MKEKLRITSPPVEMDIINQRLEIGITSGHLSGGSRLWCICHGEKLISSDNERGRKEGWWVYRESDEKSRSEWGNKRCSCDRRITARGLAGKIHVHRLPDSRKANGQLRLDMVDDSLLSFVRLDDEARCPAAPKANEEASVLMSHTRLTHLKTCGTSIR
ncbi:hypothetical protein NQZ68_038199 [Dissostichus eleginoides]|nr:hypothetical protein NQZ68_038199 [Dissostichus eleginoides]